MTDRPPCPICRRPKTREYRPFCSKRCADVDLGRWLTGRYAIASRPDEQEDAEDGPSAVGGGREVEED